MIAWDLALTRGVLVNFGAIADAAEVGYGLGWRRVSRDGHRVIEHDGDAIGTRTYFVRYLDLPLTVIILSNQARFEVEKLERKIADHFMHDGA